MSRDLLKGYSKNELLQFISKCKSLFNKYSLDINDFGGFKISYFSDYE
jgi:hypothetical protein